VRCCSRASAAADHDSRLVREALGDVPLGGFFGNGEIGPVHRRTFLHGYTSAFAMFRRKQPLA
jgi:small ligand-binding sensory domain FIST